MKLGYTIIYVPSVPSTLSFYQKAFNIATRFIVPTNDYGELDIPDSSTTLAFAAESFVQKGLGGDDKFRLNRLDDNLAPGAEISLVVDKKAGEDVESVFKRAVEAGARVVKEPEKKPWGQVVGYLRDCNGFLVEVCTPVKED